MTNHITDILQRRAARVAGFGLLINDNIGNFREFFATESIIVTGDAAKTANNIIANELLFRCTS